MRTPVKTEKPQDDAMLKNLRQKLPAKIAACLTEKSSKRRPGKVGIKVSQLRRQLEKNAAVCELLMAHAKKADPTLTPEKLREIGQMFFSEHAIDQQDAKLWDLIQRIQILSDRIAIERDKLRLEVRKYKAQAKKSREILVQPELSPEERETRMREVLGI